MDLNARANEGNDGDNAPNDRVLDNRRLIQDFNHYLEQHGLRDGEDENSELSELNLAEANARVRAADKYQQSIHESIFGKDDQTAATTDDVSTDPEGRQRTRFLESLGDETLEIRSSSGVIPHVPLRRVAEMCDAVYVLASSRHLYQASRDAAAAQPPRLELSLTSYQHKAVRQFVDMMFTTTRPYTDVVSADCVVECCQIAHYVQCSSVLDVMVDILVESVDTANCLSMCELADQLELPILFERALGHMMKTLGDLEEQEVWEDLSVELRDRIAMIQQAIQTSIHSNGSSRLYFGSLTEYLAIFAENVQYHKERLAEAKERQAESTSVGAGWLDAQRKIEQQERRVQTLETIMKQQKELFASKDEACRVYLARSERQQRTSPRRD